MKCFCVILIASNFILSFAEASCFSADDLMGLNPFKCCSILGDWWPSDESVKPSKTLQAPLMQPVQMPNKLKEVELAIQRQQAEEQKKNTIFK